MSLETADARFNAGDLSGAIAAATAAVKAAPADPAARLLLAELLLFDDAFERVDTLLSAIGTLSPDLGLVVAEFRQLLRAATLRRQVAFEDALPKFLGEPTLCQQAALRTLISVRTGDPMAAARSAGEMEAARPATSGHWGSGADSGSFEDFRDADDVLGGSFEVLTTTGAYYWIPVERLIGLEFHPPRRPRDLLWRRCTASVRGGPEGDVYVPALYPARETLPDALRLGRETQWSDGSPARGYGQRLFLIGDEGVPAMQIDRVEFG